MSAPLAVAPFLETDRDLYTARALFLTRERSGFFAPTPHTGSRPRPRTRVAATPVCGAPEKECLHQAIARSSRVRGACSKSTGRGLGRSQRQAKTSRRDFRRGGRRARSYCAARAGSFRSGLAVVGEAHVVFVPAPNEAANRKPRMSNEGPP